MPSSKFEHGSGWLAAVSSMREAQERAARERGFASADEMVEADDAAERDREERQRANELAEHRGRVIGMCHGELSDATVMRLLSGKARDTHAMRAVREWSASRVPILVLAGNAGTGKSFAALAHACSVRVDCQIVRASRLGAHWERWQSDREDRVEPLRMRVPLLIVDDLGLEPLDDRRAAVAVEELFHARQGGGLRTIVTTNLTPQEARRRYSERVFSRLAESGRWVALVGDDIRRER